MAEKKSQKSREELNFKKTSEDITILTEKELLDVAGGSAAASGKTYRCPACGMFCKATGTGVNIGSHSYYPTGLHWYYKCISCEKEFLECELDGTIPPWEGKLK